MHCTLQMSLEGTRCLMQAFCEAGDMRAEYRESISIYPDESDPAEKNE